MLPQSIANSLQQSDEFARQRAKISYHKKDAKYR